MDDECVGMVIGNRSAELLQGPGSGRMRGDVEVPDASRPNLHHDKHIQDAESSRD